MVGATVLAGLVGPRRFVRAAGPPVFGAAIAWAGSVPSIVHAHSAPGIAVLGLVVGVAAAMVLARPPARGVRRIAVAAAVAATVALGVAAAAGGGLDRIGAQRLRFGEPERGAAGAAALRVAENHPLVGVGFLYPQGYFHQHISPDGWQQAVSTPFVTAEAPIRPAMLQAVRHTHN